LYRLFLHVCFDDGAGATNLRDEKQRAEAAVKAAAATSKTAKQADKPKENTTNSKEDPKVRRSEQARLDAMDAFGGEFSHPSKLTAPTTSYELEDDFM